MIHKGLTHHEAEKLLGIHGPNTLSEKSKAGNFTLFIRQFTSPLVLILCIASGISIILNDFLEGVLILCILIANALLGFIQENKAEHALTALKHMTLTLARVIRDGSIEEIDSKLLVPGDSILLEEGNIIPADATLIETMHLEVNESALTGESMSVEKNIKDKEMKLVFMGTTVTKGRAVAIITATGMKTKFGRIAKNLSDIVKQETSLEKKLTLIGKLIGAIALFAALVIFAVGISHGQAIAELFLTGVSLAVAAVPEGLPAVITITLALGVQRMAKKHAILRKLDAIESVGGITVIATDKTGTLTKNQMHVAKFWLSQSVYVKGATVQKRQRKIFDHLILAGIYCNTSTLNETGDNDSYQVIGDQTEGALLLLASAYKYDIQAIRSMSSITEEFSFDPNTKTMSVIIQKSKEETVVSKGAPEAILARSKRILTPDGEKSLTQQDRIKIISAYEEFAKSGLRTIAIATRRITSRIRIREKAETDLTFVGFVGIADPIREEVPNAIQKARLAGIRTIMVTGDNALTAATIGRQIGLVTSGDEIITGDQLASLTDEQMEDKIQSVRVFARTNPEQKLRIVRILQSKGHVVAVTGDGVNDALALKQADVGVAMGKSGTDVARQAADMVITDDNYATLIDAVEEGRGIYDNMKASIKYLIGCNLGEIIAILGGVLLGWPIILTPLQILYMNLATDGLQAIALAVNPKSQSIMNRSPQEPGRLFLRRDRFWLFEVSIITAIITLIVFGVGYSVGGILLGQSLAFTAIVLCQQFVYLDIASIEQSVFTRRLWKNPWMILPIVTSSIQILFLYVPFTQSIFKITNPHIIMTAMVIGITASVLLFSEVRKRIGHTMLTAL